MVEVTVQITQAMRALWRSCTIWPLPLRFPDLGQFRSGNIERKKPLQQHGTVTQVHDSA